jgi:hypothetical protein
MDHASSLSNGQERPTVEDVIDWIEEEAFRMGRLGFRKGYANPQEIFSNFSMNGSVGDFEEMDRLEHCATTAMEGVNAELSLMERRMNIMNADPPLLARAEARVDRRLLEAGMSHKDIESYPKSEKRLREKVLALYTLKHPVTEPPPGIEAWVFLGRQRERQVSVLLPLKATLAEVCECLDGVCASQDFLSVGWNQTAAQNRERGRIWRYQLTVKGQMSTLAPQSTKLLEDIDYHHLIQQITKKEGGVYSYYAILSPVRVWSQLRKPAEQ